MKKKTVLVPVYENGIISKYLEVVAKTKDGVGYLNVIHKPRTFYTSYNET